MGVESRDNFPDIFLQIWVIKFSKTESTLYEQYK